MDVLANSSLAFLVVLAGVLFVGRFASARFAGDRRRTRRRVRELEGSTSAIDLETQSDWLRRTLASTGHWLDRTIGGRSSDIDHRLGLAGLENPNAAATFHVVRVALVAVCAILAVVLAGAFVESSGQRIVFGVAGGLLGFLIPSLVLSSLVSRRQRRLRNALPDALDMLVLSVEGGGSLNAAIAWVADEIIHVHRDLGREMSLIQREMLLGMSAGESFRAFADRSEISEIRDLAAAILQSEKYGASIAKLLRTFSDSARQDRQLWAEEVAQKAAVKVIFPMLLCIFPAMFIVILGPAAMQMSQLFVR